MNIEEQYDKIYRYCYFKLKNRNVAEDITQETFLHFINAKNYKNTGQALNYLYTIAKNLCINEYKKIQYEPLCDEISSNENENKLVEYISLNKALSELDESEREMIFMRYVNEVPVSVMCKIYNVSRFVLYRRIKKIKSVLYEKLKTE